MGNTMVATLQWHLYRAFERLGYIGNLAIALFGLLIIAYFSFVRPLSLSLDEAKSLSIEQPNQIQQTAMTEEEELKAFQHALPSVANRASKIQSFMDIAIAEDLQPNEVAYKTEDNAGDLLSHYHVEFSLYAPYPDIQRFLSLSLHQLNYVSIENISFNRESVKDENVEARIHLVFHFNKLAKQAALTTGEAL